MNRSSSCELYNTNTSCSPNHLDNLIVSTIFVATGLFLFLFNFGVIILYVKRKNKKWTPIDVLRVLLFSSISLIGLYLIYPALTNCFSDLKMPTCLFEYSIFYCLIFHFCVVNLLISIERLMIITLNSGFKELSHKFVNSKFWLFLFIFVYNIFIIVLTFSPLLFGWHSNCNKCSFSISIDPNYVLINSILLLIIINLTLMIYFAIYFHIKNIYKKTNILEETKDLHLINSRKLVIKSIATQTILFLIVSIFLLPFFAITIVETNLDVKNLKLGIARNYIICFLMVALAMVPIIFFYRVSFLKNLIFKRTK